MHTRTGRQAQKDEVFLCVRLFVPCSIVPLVQRLFDGKHERKPYFGSNVEYFTFHENKTLLPIHVLK